MCGWRWGRAKKGLFELAVVLAQYLGSVSTPTANVLGLCWSRLVRAWNELR